MHAVILERNKLVGRKVARFFLSVGASAVTVEEPEQVARVSADADVLCADTFDGDFVAEQVRAQSAACAACCGRPSRSSDRCATSSRRRTSITCSRAATSSRRRARGRCSMVARRLECDARRPGTRRRSARRISTGAFSSLDLDVRVDGRSRCSRSRRSRRSSAALQVPKRVADMFGELGHELLMNAMYDAPADAHGRPKYAADRKADIRLADNERPACRGSRPTARGSCCKSAIRSAASSARHVVDGLARGLAGGEMDQLARWGGAGHDGLSQLVVGDVLRRRDGAVTPRSPRCSSST